MRSTQLILLLSLLAGGLYGKGKEYQDIERHLQEIMAESCNEALVGFEAAFEELGLAADEFTRMAKRIDYAPEAEPSEQDLEYLQVRRGNVRLCIALTPLVAALKALKIFVKTVGIASELTCDLLQKIQCAHDHLVANILALGNKKKSASILDGICHIRATIRELFPVLYLALDPCHPLRKDIDCIINGNIIATLDEIIERIQEEIPSCSGSSSSSSSSSSSESCSSSSDSRIDSCDDSRIDSYDDCSSSSSSSGCSSSSYSSSSCSSSSSSSCSSSSSSSSSCSSSSSSSCSSGCCSSSSSISSSCDRSSVSSSECCQPTSCCSSSSCSSSSDGCSSSSESRTDCIDSSEPCPASSSSESRTDCIDSSSSSEACFSSSSESCQPESSSSSEPCFSSSSSENCNYSAKEKPFQHGSHKDSLTQVKQDAHVQAKDAPCSLQEDFTLCEGLAFSGNTIGTEPNPADQDPECEPFGPEVLVIDFNAPCKEIVCTPIPCDGGHVDCDLIEQEACNTEAENATDECSSAVENFDGDCDFSEEEDPFGGECPAGDDFPEAPLCSESCGSSDDLDCCLEEDEDSSSCGDSGCGSSD